jgi:diguanylate cyclase (GGDEF)-like protein
MSAAGHLMGKFKRLYTSIVQPSPVLIWSATAAGLLIQLAVFGAIAFEFYRSTLDSSFKVAENIAALIEQDIARNIELYDLSLQAVAEKVDDPEVLALSPRLRQMAVFDRSTTAPGLGAMVVLDKGGTIILDSLSESPRGGNFSDREYFKFQRDTPRANGFYISRPFQARLQDGTWSISISRRLGAADGSFAGIVSGTLKLDFLRDRLDSMALGAHGLASLFRDDGTVLVQNIADNPNVGTDWSRAAVFRHAQESISGSFASGGALDGVPRLYAFSRVSGFPLIVAAGIARSDVLAPWWFKIELIALVFAGMAGSVVVLVAMFNRELRRRIAAERGQAALARQDRLSQLANRLGFDEALATAWRRAARDRQPLSLLMIDVDRFKQFNDRYGHPEGDKVLTAIGGAIGGATRRPGDVAARYGGEEFAVLLPNTGTEGAMLIAERIRKNVLAAAMPHERSSHCFVTVSLGVATIVPGKNMDEKTMLVENADRALYAAKAGGRNKVCFDNVALISDPVRFRA